MWVRPLARSDETCGGKAMGLARLIAAGLPVPDGFVIDGDAFRSLVGELPAERDTVGHALEQAAARIAEAPVIDEVVERAAALGTLAVRSSASIEDTASGSAAGVFSSETAVAPNDVWPAVRAVWTSALTPLAAAYGHGRAIAIGVIVQRFIPGERVTIYTRPPGVPDGTQLVVQRGEHVREYPRDDGDPLVVLALRAEHAIGATRGADVELVVDRAGSIWIVQARPIVHPPPPKRVPPPPALLASLVADGRRWTWDVAHNPDPLSPAQAGLVERVERARVAPWSLRVCAGYLYSAPRVEVTADVADRADLEARAAALEARFAQLLDVQAPPLDVAIERYLAFYAVWANELVPLIAAARRGATLEQLAGARPAAVESTLLAAARGEIEEHTAIERLAPLSPAWDVAVPTFGERPDVIRVAIARARELALHALPRDTSNELVRAAADLAERDDVWFARAQLLVRQALLRRGAELGVDEDDICWLSLDDLDKSVDPDDARRRASAARAAHERASKWAMPLVIGEQPADDRPVLHGFGSGARVAGRVVRFASLATAVAVTSGDVIVTRAITPALAVFVVGCAAIVSETGGPLDHGAAIARELGVPFVVSCKDAWSLLHDGMLVTIDGNRVIPTRN